MSEPLADEFQALAPTSSPLPLPDPGPLFDQFWQVYPRKVSKGDAKRNWCRALRKGATEDQIIAAAERFRDECAARRTQKEYIPHPSSWLAKERYSDEGAGNDSPLPLSSPSRTSRSRPARPAFSAVNDEQLLATVIRLTADQDHPVTAAIAIIDAIQQQARPGPGPIITVPAERGAELAAMPYPEYLQTPEWQARRQFALDRAEWRCQVCNREDRLHVHHNTYERRGVERAADLIVLCEDCHGLYHGKGLLAETA